MKSLFYSGMLLLIVFEVANVFFIMPMPGSQEMESIGLAYFLYSKRTNRNQGCMEKQEVAGYFFNAGICRGLVFDPL